jgi:AraC-like DNA-binding protein
MSVLRLCSQSKKRLISQEMTGKTKTYFEIQIDKLVKEVRQSKSFMEKYLSGEIEVAKMASTAFMSKFHYTRIFKKVYGLSPRQYLKDLRINKAKELLKQGLNVTQVCMDVGYDSVPTFCNIFKKATGYSPGEYRNLNKSNLE